MTDITYQNYADPIGAGVIGEINSWAAWNQGNPYRNIQERVRKMTMPKWAWGVITGAFCLLVTVLLGIGATEFTRVSSGLDKLNTETLPNVTRQMNDNNTALIKAVGEVQTAVSTGLTAMNGRIDTATASLGGRIDTVSAQLVDANKNLEALKPQSAATPRHR